MHPGPQSSQEKPKQLPRVQESREKETSPQPGAQEKAYSPELEAQIPHPTYATRREVIERVRNILE